MESRATTLIKVHKDEPTSVGKITLASDGEGENRVHMQVTVFENASTASRYVDEKVLSLNRRRSIGYDSEDWESVPFEHSSSFVRRVAPPETDRLITYNIEDLLTGEEPSFSEGVIYRVGR